MNIIKRTLVNGSLAYYTYSGWVVFNPGTPLDLSDVVRFTDGERKCFILRRGDEWQEFGCYKALK